MVMRCYKCNGKIKKGQPYVGVSGRVVCVPCYGPERAQRIKVKVPKHVSRLKNPTGGGGAVGKPNPTATAYTRKGYGFGPVEADVINIRMDSRLAKMKGYKMGAAKSHIGQDAHPVERIIVTNPYEQNFEVSGSVMGMGGKVATSKEDIKGAKMLRKWSKQDIKGMKKSMKRAKTNPEFYAEKDFYNYLNKHFGSHESMEPMLVNELRLCYDDLYEDNIEEVKRRMGKIDNILMQRPELFGNQYVQQRYNVIVSAMQSYGVPVEMNPRRRSQRNPVQTMRYPIRVYDRLALMLPESYLVGLGVDPNYPAAFTLKRSIGIIENYINGELRKIGYPMVSISADQSDVGSEGMYNAWISLNNARITGPHKSVRQIALFMPEIIAETTEMEQNPVRYPRGMRKRMMKQVAGARRQYLQPGERELLKQLDPSVITQQNPEAIGTWIDIYKDRSKAIKKAQKEDDKAFNAMLKWAQQHKKFRTKTNGRRRAKANPTDLTPQFQQIYRQRMLGRKLGQPMGAATASWRTNPRRKLLSWPEHLGIEHIEEERKVRRIIHPSKFKPMTYKQEIWPEFGLTHEIEEEEMEGIIPKYPESIMTDPALESIIQKAIQQRRAKKYGHVRRKKQIGLPKQMRHGEAVATMDAYPRRPGEKEEEYEFSEKLRVETRKQQLEEQYKRPIKVAVSPPHIRGFGAGAKLGTVATYYFYVETDWDPYGQNHS